MRKTKAELLVDEHMALVSPIAKALKAKLPHPLEDLEQAGMVGLIEAAKRYDGRVPFPAYARQRIRGAILDFARGDRVFGRQRLRIARADMPTELLSRETVARLESTIDAACIIALGLQTLTDAEYALVQMAYRQGLGIEESAKGMNIKPGTARNLKARAIKKLRKAVLKPAA